MNRALSIVGVAWLIVAVWLSGYSGREALRSSQLAACERGKLDRSANALGWRSAQQARLATARDPSVGKDERSSAWDAAQIYDHIADGLEARAQVDCEQAFPAPSLLPDL